jgi:hypothetical protein
MVLDNGPAVATGNTRRVGPHHSRWAGARFRVLRITILSITAGLVALGGPIVARAEPAWAAGASFVPDATSASWDGSVVQVTFREIGVAPGGTTTVSAQATGTVDVECRQGSLVLVRVHATSSVDGSTDAVASDAGTVDGTLTLALVVGAPGVSGLGCQPHETRTVSVILRDLTTGASLVVDAAAGTGGGR